MNNISLNQALAVWSELWQAYYGKHGFGGDTAEIYASRVMPHSPILTAKGFKNEKKQIGLEAAHSLYAILKKFEKDSVCKIHVDGRLLGSWFTKMPFDYRCHVRVIKL